VNLNAWHQDQVIKRPSDAKPLAGNDFCENAALIYGKKAFTVQPHPEFNSDVIDNKNLAAMVTRFFKERTLS